MTVKQLIKRLKRIRKEYGDHLLVTLLNADGQEEIVSGVIIGTESVDPIAPTSACICSDRAIHAMIEDAIRDAKED